MFLVSHLSAMAYAIENQGDWTMATLFLTNAVGCGLVILIAGLKRSGHRRRAASAVVAPRGPRPSRAFLRLRPASSSSSFPRLPR